MSNIKLVTVLSDQPIRSLLPIRFLKPAEVLLVGRRQMHAVSQHLAAVLKNETKLHLLEITDPYNPIGVYHKLKDAVSRLGWLPHETIFNLTGGTKMMAFGAYHLAHDYKSDFVYLEEWDNRPDVLNRYHFEHGVAKLAEQHTVPPVISIADYLNIHLPGFDITGFSSDDRRLTAGGRFEKTIHDALAEHVDEVLAGVRPKGVGNQIEIDLVARCGNRVGVIEAKTGVKKQGIDQLDTAGGQHYLGEHVAKILVTGGRLSRAYHALATAQNIRIIELPEYRERYGLSDRDKHHLARTVHETLTCPRRAA